MGTEADIERVERFLQDIAQDKLVPLATVARARGLLGRLRDPTPAQALLAAAELMLEESAQGLEAQVLRRVAAVCAGHPRDSVEEIARRAARDRDFMRFNNHLRRIRAAEFPVRIWLVRRVPVRPHLRQGRWVGYHERLIGYGHLILARLAGYPDPVPAVIACLVDGRHRLRSTSRDARSTPRGRRDDARRAEIAGS